jgi:hypothetical protein
MIVVSSKIIESSIWLMAQSYVESKREKNTFTKLEYIQVFSLNQVIIKVQK